MIRIRYAAERTEQRKERQRHKQLSWFLPQHGSSPVPLALPRRFHYNHKITTAQYFLSMRLHKTMLKHTRKSLPMLKH
ncbi:hypothetical protein MTR_2g083955 [Medicago truncatula]|nr:hypothetical protein MTR_3g062680 [Medicago truncatula]KEH38857.1 hypothetical protein MTR_2g083955 [Medicago truncatula]